MLRSGPAERGDLLGDSGPGRELSVVEAELERFGEIVRPAVLSVVPTDGEESVERLLGDVWHLAVVLTSHTG